MKTFESFIAQFKDLFRRVRMQASVRELVRERLSAYADMHEVVEAVKERFTFARFVNMHALRAGFALLLVLVGAGGVAYASYDTVPGNALYSVKVRFVEPLESSLLVDAKSRATWNAILAERRLAEAATLAVGESLDTETRIYLQDQFEVFATRSDGAADEVRGEGDVATALTLRSDLEARLSAHADLFSYLTIDEESNESESRQLLAVVARTRDAVSAERQQTETETSERALAYAGQDIDAAAQATEDVARLAEAAGGVVSGNIEARLMAARSAIANARQSLAKEERGGAYVATRAAARLTQEAAILARNKAIVARADRPRPIEEQPAQVMTMPTAKEPAAPEEPVFGITATTSVDVDATTASEDEEGKEQDNVGNEKQSSGDNDASQESQKKESKNVIESVKSFIGL